MSSEANTDANGRAPVYILKMDDEAMPIAWLAKEYPGHAVIQLNKREWREKSAWQKVLSLKRLHGAAFIVLASSLVQVAEVELYSGVGVVHGCDRTILLDIQGHVREWSKLGAWFTLPKLLLRVAWDAVVLVLSWLFLKVSWTEPVAFKKTILANSPMRVAYVLPNVVTMGTSGGGVTHVTGVINGLRKNGSEVMVYSALPVPHFDSRTKVMKRPRWNLLREADTLYYSWSLPHLLRADFEHTRPSFIYQRHMRYAYAGAWLARCTGVPLVLEFNGFEEWVAQHWDPARFLEWIRIAEGVSIHAATLIVVVSSPLKKMLVERGIAESRILVNPNGVDSDLFQPGCAGHAKRSDYGIADGEIVITFVGTFSYYHGVRFLAAAIASMSAEQLQNAGGRLRFLFIGAGLFWDEIKHALRAQIQDGTAIMLGTVAHDQVPALLDISDIMVAPHEPLPDGTPFFGSPTKIFEYMAMGKAIVASRLEQIAEVLEDGRTAKLVAPGNAEELAAAILQLAGDAAQRGRLGAAARSEALAHHTWQAHAARILERVRLMALAPEAPR